MEAKTATPFLLSIVLGAFLGFILSCFAFEMRIQGFQNQLSDFYSTMTVTPQHALGQSFLVKADFLPAQSPRYANISLQSLFDSGPRELPHGEYFVMATIQITNWGNQSELIEFHLIDDKGVYWLNLHWRLMAAPEPEFTPNIETYTLLGHGECGAAGKDWSRGGTIDLRFKALRDNPTVSVRLLQWFVIWDT